MVCGVLDLELESNQSMIEFAIGHPYNGIEQWDHPFTNPVYGDLLSNPLTLVNVGKLESFRDNGALISRLKPTAQTKG